MAMVFAGSVRDQVAASPLAGVQASRVTSLDSLRGLAALSVVICHYLILLGSTPFGQHLAPWLQVPPLSLFRTAYGAVILFFVLSGYVLALSINADGGQPRWSGFAVRRFCRIWPPFALTIAVSFALGCMTLAADPSLPPVWQINTWHTDDVTLSALASQIGMVSPTIGLDAPGWSLVHEMRITLAFPLLVILLRRAPAITIGTAFCIHFANRHGPLAFATLIPDTATYIVYFAAGAGLALYGDRIGALRQATFLSRLLLVAVSLLLLSAPSDNRWSDLIAGAGAVLLIAVVTTSPEFGRALSAAWCVFLGRISYSLYLTHVVVLTALGTLLGAWLPIWLILLIAVPIIGLTAWISYRWVERPSIRLGRAVANGARARSSSAPFSSNPANS